MPNWSENTLILKGTAKEIKDFDNRFKSKHTGYNGGFTTVLAVDSFIKNLDENVIDYRVTPIDNNSRFEINYITKIIEEEKYSFYNFKQITKDNYLNGWYQWNVDNLGTKWDVNEVYPSGLDLVDEAIEEGESDLEIEFVYSFLTAWNPPLPIIETMSSMYPNIEFELLFDIEGENYAARYRYLNGSITSEDTSDEDNYKEFMQNYFDYEYYTCSKCSSLLDEYDLYDTHDSDEAICPECGSKDIYDLNKSQLLKTS